MDKCVERLEDYIREDFVYSNYKQKKYENFNDFEKYCIQHCQDIEYVLNEYKKLKKLYEKVLTSNN